MVYLINRTPTQVLHGKIPFEILFKNPSNYSHLRIFGCQCFVFYRTSDKFQPCSRKGVFLGYSYSQKGWKILDPTTKKNYVSRDVLLTKQSFHFLKILILLLLRMRCIASHVFYFLAHVSFSLSITTHMYAFFGPSPSRGPLLSCSPHFLLFSPLLFLGSLPLDQMTLGRPTANPLFSCWTLHK